MKRPAVYMFIASIVADDRLALGSGHGPVFVLAPKKSKAESASISRPFGALAKAGTAACFATLSDIA